MDGVEFARTIEMELANRGIKKGDFYNATGISATAMYGWKRGSTPTMETIASVEKYLDIKFSDGKSKVKQHIMDKETEEILDAIRTRPDLHVLFRSACNAPPSSIYQVVAQLEKEKERNAE